MISDSLYLIAASAASAIGGFVYWLVAARLTTPADIGFASGLIASSSVLLVLCDLGLSVTLLRYGADSATRLVLLTAAVRAAIIVQCLAVFVYLVGLPLWSPSLLSIRDSVPLLVVFLLFTVGNQIMAYQDMAMLAAGRPQFILWRNIACNLPPLLLLLALTSVIRPGSLLAYAFMLPNLFVVVWTSLVTLPRELPGYRPLGTFHGRKMLGMWRYGLGNHTANLLWILPALVMPVLAINVHSLQQGGVFAIAWAVANGTYLIPRTVSTALFTRLSQLGTASPRPVLVAIAFVMICGLPAVLALLLFSSLVLGFFGESYVDPSLLHPLLLAYVPFAIISQLFSVTRISRHIGWITLFSAVYSLVALLSVRWFGAVEISGISRGWLIGNVLALVPLALIALLSTGYRVAGPRELLKMIFVLSLLSSMLAAARSNAHAQQPVSAGCVEQNRTSESLIMRCDFAAADQTARDTLTILFGEAAQAGLEFTDPSLQLNALWLFDSESDGDLELAIRFRPDGAALAAELYASPSEKLQVALRANEQRLTPPDVLVVVADGWWKRDGKINFNLDITVDGPIVAAFVSEEVLQQTFNLDGTIDMEVVVRDRDYDGHPDFDWRSVRFPEPRTDVTRNVAGSNVMVKVAGRETLSVPVFPWPHLGPLTYGYITSDPRPVGPPIQVDWGEGRIVTIGEFVRSRNNKGQWFVYSKTPLLPEVVNAANFENPFAWYDLARDGDASPELVIRQTYYEPNDPFFLQGRFDEPYSQIRYAWDITGEGKWDYKFGLFGRRHVDSVIRLPEFSLQTVPYDHFPDWVVRQPWEAATFVAADDGAVGEGIYEWDMSTWLREQYFTGILEDYLPQSDQYNMNREALFNELDQIGIGFRGEYQLDYAVEPALYVSPVDNRLHLLWADQGLWRLDEEQVIRLGNMNRDRHIDVWSRVAFPSDEVPNAVQETVQTPDGPVRSPVARADSEVFETLYALDGYLLHMDSAGVTLVKADYDASVIEIHPPTDHDSWIAQRALLDNLDGASRSPGNLRGWLTDFPGPRVYLPGGSVSNPRLIDGGFRFELVVGNEAATSAAPLMGTRSLGNDPGALSALGLGRYLVVYNANNLTVEPITPPEILIDMAHAHPDDPIEVIIRNVSSADVYRAQLVTQMVVGDTLRLDWRKHTIHVPAREITRVLVEAPLALEDVRLVARVDDVDGGELAAASGVVIQAARYQSEVSVFGIDQVLSLFPVLLFFALALGLTTLLASGRSHSNRN